MCGIAAQEAEGFAEVIAGGGKRAVAPRGAASGPGSMNYEHGMGPYVPQMADRLDDEKKVHACNGETAYRDLEIMAAICWCTVQRGKARQPRGPVEPELEALRKALPA
jgi:hypothetical protein